MQNSRVKRVLGGTLRSCRLPAQRTEPAIATSPPDRMAEPGAPRLRRVTSKQGGWGKVRPSVR
jgi:hypothetical protein